MSKILVKPQKVKAFILLPNGNEIQAFRPTVVSRSPFISNLMAQSKITLATDVEISDSVTDEDFEKIYNSAAVIKSGGGDLVKRGEAALATFIEKHKDKKASEEASTTDK